MSLVSWVTWCPALVHSYVKGYTVSVVLPHVTSLKCLCLLSSHYRFNCLQDTTPTCCERVEGTGEALLSALVKRPSDMEYATLAKPPSLPVAKLVGAWKPMS
jgi:hypothetical protein